jgi:hypothetical protein
MKTVWIPATPAGTPLLGLAAGTEREAWEKLLADAAHMPYRGIGGFKQRGYTVTPHQVPKGWTYGR